MPIICEKKQSSGKRQFGCLLLLPEYIDSFSRIWMKECTGDQIVSEGTGHLPMHVERFDCTDSCLSEYLERRCRCVRRFVISILIHRWLTKVSKILITRVFCSVSSCLALIFRFDRDGLTRQEHSNQLLLLITVPPLRSNGSENSRRLTIAQQAENPVKTFFFHSRAASRCVLMIRSLEPGLFECTGWYVASESNNALIMPRFLTKKEFLENKYSVDKHYREQMTNTEISQVETELEFYQRSHAVTTSILKMHENEYISQIQQGQSSPQQNLHVLFIGKALSLIVYLCVMICIVSPRLAHAPSLETCTRKLCGGKFRPDTLAHVIRNVDFLTVKSNESLGRMTWTFCSILLV